MGRRAPRDIGIDELRKAYKDNEDFKNYVDKSKFPDLETAFQNMMVRYYYLYLMDDNAATG